MTDDEAAHAYLFVRSRLGKASKIHDERIAGFTERHKHHLNPNHTDCKPVEEYAGTATAGTIIELEWGLPDAQQLALSREVLNANRRLFYYWPLEHAIECIGRERYCSIKRHVRALQMIRSVQRHRRQILSLAGKVAGKYQRMFNRPLPVSALISALDPQAARKAVEDQLERLIPLAVPVAMPPFSAPPSAGSPLAGTGVYLRMDFWASISSGGSYGHTCYVAKNLARTTERFVAYMANRYALLNEMELNQQVLEPFATEGAEINLLRASQHYYQILYPTLKSMRPSYMYERVCLGNFAAARLSQELKIPYLVEYNGSEISMQRSFDGCGYDYEDVYLKAEELAFKQATLISVVSDAVRDDLLARGVDPKRILVNPNGADPDVYAPPSAAEKNAIRSELGFSPGDRVIGFSGTFGGWHGVDSLAEGLPLICRKAENARFLMIGDGNYKHLVDSAIEEHELQGKVVCTGRVPQAEGARLLRACDIFVSPHSAHMVDSRFFGSPTKVFEYMAVGGAIVASDLEQIGVVLSPAVRIDDLVTRSDDVLLAEAEDKRQRAVLYQPGNVGEFVAAVTALVHRPPLSEVLGRNARQAVIDHYSWEKHVGALWTHLQGLNQTDCNDVRVVRNSGCCRMETGDVYKNEAQNQWDHDACGSHYVKGADPHTLAWYKEAERFRYGEYAPWMFETMEFARHPGKKVLEIGAGIGTDLAQFARYGSQVTDIDLSAGHLELARENFRLRGLDGTFIHQDAESLPFEDGSFDVVYSNGMIHHTPNTSRLVGEIFRVLKEGGRVITMVYAENSLHYWLKLFYDEGVRQNKLATYSMGAIMSETVEIGNNDARPLVKVYTRTRLKRLFSDFDDIHIVQRQLTRSELPRLLKWVPANRIGPAAGWNLILKASKPS